MTQSEDSNQGTGSRNKEEKKRKILSVLEKNPEGLFPKPVARYAGLNPSTVRSYLRELEDEGKVENEGGIYSVIEENHEGEIPLPNIHNMRVEVDIPEEVEVEHKEEEYEFPFAEMSIEVGETNHRATGVISAEPPVSLNVGYLLTKTFADEVQRLVGFEVDYEEEVTINSCEFNKDHFGVRLDGANCITFRDLYEGVEEKLYNKEDKVRHEVRLLNQPLSPETLGNLVVKGTTFSHLSKRYRELKEGVEDMRQDYDKVIRQQSNITKLLKELLEKNGKMRDALRGDEAENFSKGGEPNG